MIWWRGQSGGRETRLCFEGSERKSGCVEEEEEEWRENERKEEDGECE